MWGQGSGSLMHLLTLKTKWSGDKMVEVLGAFSSESTLASTHAPYVCMGQTGGKNTQSLCGKTQRIFEKQLLRGK